MMIYGAGSLDEIKMCTSLGCEGILTNPQGFEQYFDGETTLMEITEAIAGVTDLPFFVQIHGTGKDELVRRALELNAVSKKQIGFKIISDEKGFLAIRELQNRGINCIATTLFSLSQACVAATVGAFGVCPFVSRGTAIGMDMGTTLKAMKTLYSGLENPPLIVAVSLKGVRDVELALKAGADVVGMRYPLIKEMMEHPLSQKAELLFAKNWMNVKGEDMTYMKHALGLDGTAEDSVH